ncbi:ferrous iron transport protein A [Lentisphaerota bacterium ZTH]|nr:ferrous iron transport protein A [Lentisphaerota bacterium]WET07030.1 ferrous iron transport protein A [Lentisphaerota bacterium ZTH]
MTLSDTKEGDVVKVVKIKASSAIRQRMLDMGIIPSSEIKVERYAPLRDPIQIKIKGYSLALRVSEGNMVEVEPLA